MPRQKFVQIYAALKERIESGTYPVGQLLPSENTLIVEFDCSRNTVRRAIAELVRDGYVQTSQGKGVCNIFQPIEQSSYTMGCLLYTSGPEKRRPDRQRGHGGLVQAGRRQSVCAPLRRHGQRSGGRGGLLPGGPAAGAVPPGGYPGGDRPENHQLRPCPPW